MIVVAHSAYNEEIKIGRVVSRVRKYVDKDIVVDDGSTDKTSAVVRLVVLEVIRHDRSLGNGSALKSAFEYARHNNIDILVSDGPHNPDVTPVLVFLYGNKMILEVL